MITTAVSSELLRTTVLPEPIEIDPDRFIMRGHRRLITEIRETLRVAPSGATYHLVMIGVYPLQDGQPGNRRWRKTLYGNAIRPELQPHVLGHDRMLALLRPAEIVEEVVPDDA